MVMLRTLGDHPGNLITRPEGLGHLIRTNVPIKWGFGAWLLSLARPDELSFRSSVSWLPPGARFAAPWQGQTGYRAIYNTPTAPNCEGIRDSNPLPGLPRRHGRSSIVTQHLCFLFVLGGVMTPTSGGPRALQYPI